MRLFPLQLFSATPRFDFMGKRWWGFSFSILMTLVALGLFFTKGLNLGIDFTGGVLMEVRTEKAADLGDMRELLSGQAEFGEVSLQNFGSDRDVMIRIQAKENIEQGVVVAKVKALLAEHMKEALEYRKVDYVGPTVGQELIDGAIIAVLLSFAAIMMYVWFRFEWQFGVGAIAALIHDSIMMIGFFAITRFEFGLTAIAAILTVVGYSINDSVVIYDRIRENMRRFKKMPIEELLNLSMNETLARTIMTSTSTLLAAMALYLFGGEVLKGFSGSLVFGILVGTYSSIYISAPTLIYLRLRPPASTSDMQEARS